MQLAQCASQQLQRTMAVLSKMISATGYGHGRHIKIASFPKHAVGINFAHGTITT